MKSKYSVDSSRVNRFMAMHENDLLNELSTLLRQHTSENGAVPIRGYPGQEPYRSDIFIIFKALHQRKRNPIYFQDAINKLKQQGQKIECDPKILEEINSMWAEWAYCWSI